MSKGESKQVCEVCGGVLPAGGMPAGCPRCLLRNGLTEVLSSAYPAGSGFEPPSVQELGRSFDQLEIVEFVGRGGMGAVYKARQIRLNRMVALKIIPVLDDSPEVSERFMREAQALARMNHQNIVTIYDVGEQGGYYYFIMEFVEGTDLGRKLVAGSLVPHEALGIAGAICDALEYAHNQGVVHRDIKPANVLIDKAGRVKIADFGLAKVVGPDSQEPALTLTREWLGTPYYMAPEQRDPGRRTDHRADIYSLGVILYEMLTGAVPAGSFEPPSRNAAVNSVVDGTVIRMLKMDPDARYRDAAEAGAAVRKSQASGIVSRGGRWRMFAAVAAVAGVGIAALGVFAALRMTGGDLPPLPQDAVEFAGDYYKVFFENVSWGEARRKCESLGGGLATVRSREEDDFLAALSRSHMWLGGTDEGHPGRWMWIDGSAMSYSNWDAGEPNNAPDPKSGKKEHCLMMSKYGKWNDLVDDSPIIKGFICRWDGARFKREGRPGGAEALHAALRKANPRYNGRGIFEVRDGRVTGVTLSHTGVTDLSPLRGLMLESVNVSWTDVSDLSALEGMPVVKMDLTHSKVEDLTPLAGMKLTVLRLEGSRGRDLMPLKGMALRYLDISHTKVVDLSPLSGMPLEELHMNCARVVDLTPLAGMPLRKTGLLDVPVKDLSPLGKCRELESVVVPEKADGLESLRNLPGLKRINNRDAADYWSAGAAVRVE